MLRFGDLFERSVLNKSQNAEITKSAIKKIFYPGAALALLRDF